MKKIFPLFSTTLAVVVSVLAVQSCISGKYELSEENMDMNVHIFSEGLCLPLGSTSQISLSDLLKKAGVEGDIKDFINVGEDGALSIHYSSKEPVDLSENLSSLSGILDLDKIDFSNQIDFSLDGVNIKDVSYAGMTYELQQSLTDIFGQYNIAVPSISEFFNMDLGSDMDVDVEFDVLSQKEFKSTPTFAALPEHFEVPTEISEMTTPISISEYNTYMRDLGKKEISLKTEISADPISVSYAQEFHKGVKSVSDIHLKEGAKIQLSVSVVDPFFTSGSIIPNVDIDFSKVFHLKDTENDHINSEFELNKENRWSAQGEYFIESLVVEEGDWK